MKIIVNGSDRNTKWLELGFRLLDFAWAGRKQRRISNHTRLVLASKKGSKGEGRRIHTKARQRAALSPIGYRLRI